MFEKYLVCLIESTFFSTSTKVTSVNPSVEASSLGEVVSSSDRWSPSVLAFLSLGPRLQPVSDDAAFFLFVYQKTLGWFHFAQSSSSRFTRISFYNLRLKRLNFICDPSVPFQTLMYVARLAASSIDLSPVGDKIL